MRKFNQIIPGNIILVDAGCGAIHEFFVKSVEDDPQNGRTLCGTDLSCLELPLKLAEARALNGLDVPEDYETEEYIGSVTEDMFCGLKRFSFRTCKIVLCEGEPEEKQIICFLPDVVIDYIKDGVKAAKEWPVQLGGEIYDVGIVDRIIYPEPKSDFAGNKKSTLFFTGKEFRKIANEVGFIPEYDIEGISFTRIDMSLTSLDKIYKALGNRLGVKVTSVHNQIHFDENDGSADIAVWVIYEKQEVRL